MTEINQAQNGNGNQARPDQGSRPFSIHTDIPMGIAIILFSALVYYLTTTFDEVPAAMAQGIPPTQFPRLLIAIMSALAVIMMFQTRGQEPKKRKPVPRVAFLSAALLVVFVAIVDWFGIIAAMFLFCIALPIAWGERRFGPILIYASIFPVLVYLLFSRVMEVNFPLGFFGQFFD